MTKLIKYGAIFGGTITAAGLALAQICHADSGTLTASDTLPIVQGGIDSLKANLLAFLPLILPVAITLSVFFGAYYWIKHAGHGR